MDLRETNPDNRHRHPWELARAAALLSFVNGWPRSTRYADIGAGDRFFTRMLAARSDLPVLAVDTAYASTATHDGCLLLPGVAAVPPASIEFMFVMDMLEHVSDDAAFVRALARIAVPGGRAVFTVPAHPHLFSAHDEFLGHRRRYTRARLRAVLDAAGFRIDELFAFFLAPLVAREGLRALHWLQLHQGVPSGVGNWPRREQHIVTRTLTCILCADFTVNRFLAKVCTLSAGLSLCALCTAAEGRARDTD